MTTHRLFVRLALGAILTLSAARADLLVAYRDGTIQRYDPTTGTSLGAFASMAGTQWEDIVVGPDGDLYASSFLGTTIQRFDPAGASLGAFTSGDAGLLQRSRSFVFGSDGNLYVSSWSQGKVLKYNAVTGAFLGIAAQGNGLINPNGLTLDGQGNLLVVDETSNSILKFSTAGAFLGAIATGLKEPISITRGPDGNFYVTQLQSGNVIRFSSTGTPLGQFIAPGSGGLGEPLYTAFGADASLFVSSFTSPAVYRFDSTGAPIGSPITYASTPIGLAVTAVSTPEPSAVWTLLPALALLWHRRRR